MDTVFAEHFKDVLASTDTSNAQLRKKVIRNLLSLTELAKKRIAEMVKTDYDVLKAQRYRDKRVEDRYRREFAEIFAQRLLSYVKDNAARVDGKYVGMAHGNLYPFSDVVIYSDELMGSILERIARLQIEPNSLRSVFLKDGLLAIINLRKGNFRVSPDGDFEYISKNVLHKLDDNVMFLKWEGIEDAVSLAFYLGKLSQMSLKADQNTIQQGIDRFLETLKNCI